MKTEAQIIRELMESLLKAGPISLEEIYDVEEVVQSQDSTYDQLVELHQLANKNGLYDAADWLKPFIQKMQAGFKK